MGDPRARPPGAGGIARTHVDEVLALLAFDRRGHRIGYGAGYYDMTIATLRAKKPLVAVGIAFAAQEIAAVPTDPSDARLDLVLTEREAIDCRVR